MLAQERRELRVAVRARGVRERRTKARLTVSGIGVQGPQGGWGRRRAKGAKRPLRTRTVSFGRPPAFPMPCTLRP